MVIYFSKSRRSHIKFHFDDDFGRDKQIFLRYKDRLAEDGTPDYSGHIIVITPDSLASFEKSFQNLHTYPCDECGVCLNRLTYICPNCGVDNAP